MTQQKKVLVVGSGITGATIAKLLDCENKYNITVMEQTSNIGGACYDSIDSGAYVQYHGAHIFNTKNKEIWDFVSRFTDWFPYMHKVKACVNGTYVPVPFNLNSIEQLFDKHFIDELYKALKSYDLGKEFTLKELTEHKNKLLRQLGDFIYVHIFKHYSYKQWGFFPEETIINRVKAFRYSKDDRYFITPYQGIPRKGYTAMIREMLYDSKSIKKIQTNKKFTLDMAKDYDIIFYTGPIDELANYRYGELPYRTCLFDFDTYKGRYIQRESSVVNYPNNYDFTRTIDFSWFMPFTLNGIFAKEYSLDFDKNDKEHVRYYPMLNSHSIDIKNAYTSYLSREYPNIIVAGRLGTFKYLNMDQAIEQAIDIVKDFIKKESKK